MNLKLECAVEVVLINFGRQRKEIIIKDLGDIFGTN